MCCFAKIIIHRKLMLRLLPTSSLRKVVFALDLHVAAISRKRFEVSDKAE